jgi:hypothetical protein
MKRNWYTDYTYCMQRAVAQASLAEDIRAGYFFAGLTPTERMHAIRECNRKVEQYALAAEKFLRWTKQAA